MGLRHKLLSLWLALLLLPLAVMGTVGYYYIDSNLRDSAIKNLQQVVSVKRDLVGGYLNRLEYLAGYFAKKNEMQILLLAEKSNGNTTNDKSVANDISVARDTMSLLAQELMASYPSIVEFQLLRKDESLRPAFFASTRANVSTPLLLRAADFESQSNNKASLFYAKVPGQRGYLVSIIPVLDEKQLTELGYVALVTTLNLIDEITNPSATLANEFFITTNDGEVITQNSRLPFTRLDLRGDALGGFERINKTLADFKIEGRDYSLNVAPLGQQLWLGSLTDNDMLLGEKNPYIIIFIMTLSLMLLFSGILFNLVVVRTVIKPLQVLNNATQQIAKGDFKPELDVRSNDEIGNLAMAFRHMGKQLSHSSRRIRQLAYYDPLTQLPNRTTLRETLNRLLTQSKRNSWKTAVLFIDLDDFKKVNDRLGHAAGDDLLVQISERLKNRLRQSDMLFDQSAGPSVDQLISRRGGDEFNAILSSIKAPHDAAVVAERIIQDLNEPFNIGGSEIHVGASVGIAIFPDDGGDADTLLRNADLAMYEAKAKGKNNYHIYTSAINKQVHQRLALESALQDALVHDQFRLYYQPKVRLQDMKTVGFEALIRWYEPKKGIILPSRFIPIAEESNLIRDIGNWVLGESMHQMQMWEGKLPEGIRIAINISARQLAQSDLVEQLRLMIEHFGLSPQRLEVELTETSVLHDEVMARQHLTDLRLLGVQISLDDFGTGYSSLNFLRKLPIDTVKIDRSFTANVSRSSETRAIVISLLNLCRQLNVKSIAEGIETTDQLQFMLEHGCDQGQGFLFSEPLPANEVMVFLEEPSFLALSPDL